MCLLWNEIYIHDAENDSDHIYFFFSFFLQKIYAEIKSLLNLIVCQLNLSFKYTAILLYVVVLFCSAIKINFGEYL